MKPGSWPSIALIYCYGVLASASLSKIIPLQADYESHLGISHAQFSLLLSLLTIPPAILASAAGSVIDRMGARTALIAAAIVGLVVNFAYLQAQSLLAFQAIRVLEGFVMVGIYSGAPALIMATTAPQRRGRAMAFWSTYTPVGIASGLLLSASFAGTEDWRGGYLLHMVLFAVMAVAGLMLPRAPSAGAVRQKIGLFSAWTQAGPLRLALAFSMLVVMGFGLNTVFPTWYSSQHEVSVGAASSLLALANLCMIPGGLIAGALLARGMRDFRLVLLLMILSVLVSLPLFMPGEAKSLRLLALLVWQLAAGASIAVVTSGLPRVVADPTQGAAAAGLLSQIAALITFVTPLVWAPVLASGWWPGFMLIVLVAATLAAMLFPAARRPSGALP